MILQIFIEFEREIIKMHENRSCLDIERSIIIKDHFRVSADLEKLFSLLNLLLVNWKSLEKSINGNLLVKSLEVMEGIIDWLPLEVFGKIIPLVIEMTECENEELIRLSLECLHSIIDKEMQSIDQKIQVMQEIGIMNVVFALGKREIESELLPNTIADVINTLGEVYVSIFASQISIAPHTNVYIYIYINL